jgi:subtilase family serine protease
MSSTLVFTDNTNNITKSNIQKAKAIKCTNFLKQNTSSVPTFPPQYFSGSQLVNLYNVPTITKTTGKKVTIVIIVAFTYPRVKNDLKTYWQNPINFGPNSMPPAINVYTMPGATQNIEWAQEECLDVQMVCTINPNANIWVVEAKSDLITDLMNALNYATTRIKADVISMSWGINEVNMLLNYTNFFSNTSVSYCAASGDNNYACWPATLSNCIAVGGTSLLWTPNSTPSRTEFTWSSAGCGYSSIIKQPTYQSGISGISNKNRVIPDVAMIANSNTSVYTVYNGNWYGVGGTSVSTPIFAGILSLANQARFNNNKGSLTTVYSSTPNNTSSTYVPPTNNIQNFMYKTIYPNTTLYSNTFYDVTIGSDMGSVSGNANVLTRYNSGKKFDVATGMGSPNATFFCNQLLTL